jgi:hypothetical protein
VGNKTIPFKSKVPQQKEGAMEEQKKIFVPYSKGNEEKKALIPQTVGLTTHAMPIPLVVNAIIQLEEQKWTVKHVLFAGMAQSSQLAVVQGQQIPVYALIITKVYCEGEEIIYPSLNLEAKPV